MSRQKQEPLVRYVSPFGSPAWMTREAAYEWLEKDDKLWLELQEVNALSEWQRQIGPPRIEVHRP